MSGESVLLELAEHIGPRPATTDTEAQAADHLFEVFAQRGLEVERQEFDAPRTLAWAYILYYVLGITAAVGSLWYPLPAIALGLIVAVVMWFDLDTRWGFTSFMPKGPSQNIVARHIPKTRRGERVRKIVIVAHYDTAKTSLAFSPGLVRNWWMAHQFTRIATMIIPVLILVQVLPWLKAVGVWAWYLTLVPAAWLAVPLVVTLHSELFMPYSEGANDNASGVATLVQVMEQVVPEPEELSSLSREMPAVPVRRTEEDAWAADVVPEDSVLSYAPVQTPRHAVGPFTDEDDLGWDEEETTPGRGQASLDFEQQAAREPSRPAERGAPEPPAKQKQKNGVSDWLGLGKNFDARKEGRKIGSWDNFGEDEDDDIGWKGGSAGDDDIYAQPDPFTDEDYASVEAARIRRKVTSANVDRSLAEKDVWFVATGAKETGEAGMKAFLAENAEELRDALIINVEAVGAGNLVWLRTEGAGRRYTGDRKLASTAKRVARELEVNVRGVDHHGPETDATVALARGFKALTFTALDINGRQPGRHTKYDTMAIVSQENVTKAADFIVAMVRDL